MKPDLQPSSCPFCKGPTELVRTTTRYRRGDVVLAVDTWTWQCAASCTDPDTVEAPYRFVDPPLMRINDQLAKKAWMDQFGHAMPDSRRGQRPGERRTVRVPVMLTPSEAKRLDRMRGEASRSEFLRNALTDDRRKTE